mgnify:CR=1 FL=1
MEELIGTATTTHTGLIDVIDFKTIYCKMNELYPKNSVFKILTINGLYTFGIFSVLFGVNHDINYSVLRVRVTGETTGNVIMESLGGGSEGYKHVEFYFRIKDYQLEIFAKVIEASLLLNLRHMIRNSAESNKVSISNELTNIDVHELKKIEIQNYKTIGG